LHHRHSYEPAAVAWTRFTKVVMSHSIVAAKE
jgi:hypothetical protein